MFRVVIVEDQRILRDGYKDFLKNGPFEVVGEAGDGMAAIKCVLKTNPDMVLLDLSLPKMDGLAVLNEIKRNVNRPKVLVLTMSDSDDKIAQAFDNGANGFCLKDTSSKELISAMKVVMSGKRYVSPSIASNVVAGYVHSRAKGKSHEPATRLQAANLPSPAAPK